MPGRQQVQVVVAQDADQRLTNGIQKSQGFQRLGTAVDQIAHQPQAVYSRVEADPFEQALQRLQAPLKVADCVYRHQCRAPGTARRNGAIVASKRLPSSATI
ncbi:hypothetical protein D3C77_488550 [compost metagenome]